MSISVRHPYIFSSYIFYILSHISSRLFESCAHSFLLFTCCYSLHTLEKKKEIFFSRSILLYLILSHSFCLAVHIDRWVCQFTVFVRKSHDPPWSHMYTYYVHWARARYQSFSLTCTFLHRGYRNNCMCREKRSEGGIAIGLRDSRIHGQRVSFRHSLSLFLSLQ